MFGDQRFELGDQLAVVTERKAGLHAGFDCREPGLVQADRLIVNEGKIGGVAECRATPEFQGSLQRESRGRGITRCQEALASTRQLLEFECVELVRLQSEAITLARGL